MDVSPPPAAPRAAVLMPMARPPPIDPRNRIGRPIKLRANCFKFGLNVGEGVLWYLYEVVIKTVPRNEEGAGGPQDGRVPPKSVLRDVWAAVEEHKRAEWGDIKPTWDGRSMAYSHSRLPEDRADSLNFVVDAGQRGRFRVTLNKAARISPHELVKYFASELSVEQSDVMDSLQALNVLVTHGLSMIFPANRHSWYFQDGAQIGLPNGHSAFPVGGGVELWRGFFTAVRTCFGGMYINIDTTTGAFLLAKQKENNLIAFALDFLGYRETEVNRLGNLTPHEMIKLSRALRTRTIDVDAHVRRSNGSEVRKLKIRVGLSNNTARTHQFTIRETGQTLSVEDYFANHYNLRLQYANLPLVEFKPGMFYPLELCSLTPGQKYNKRLTGRQTEQATRFTQLRPHDRLNTVAAVRNSTVQQIIGPQLPGWGVEIDLEPMQIEGRVLKPPTIKLKDRHGDSTANVERGAWQVARNRQQFAEPDSIPSFAVILTGRIDPRAANDFIGALMNTAMSVGMTLPQTALDPSDFVVRGRGSLEVDFKEAITRAQKGLGHAPRIVINLFDREHEEYDLFKKVGTSIGYATQAIRFDKAQRKLRDFTFTLGICMKINAKLGGLNYVHVPNTSDGNGRGPGWLEGHKALVFAADLSHSENKPSIASVVMSIDTRAQRYIDEVVVQPLVEPSATSTTEKAKRSEIIVELESMVHKLMTRFAELYPGKQPASLVFFRDGVSDSEFGAVLEHEVTAVRNACAQMGWTSKVTFIVATKRHHIRTFVENERDGEGKQCNIPAGTVFDSGVGDARAWDFYLAAHNGLIGTSRPTRFIILEDDNAFTQNELEALSFTLSHSYQRCNRAVSIPAPVYYADLIAARIRAMMPDLNGSGGASAVGTGSSGPDAAQRASDLGDWQRTLRELSQGRATLGSGRNPSLWWL